MAVPVLRILIEGNHNRRLFQDAEFADRKLGRICAKALRARLADLAAAVNAAELVAGHPHPLRGGRAGQFALNLAGGRRLAFRPGEAPPPLDADKAIAWERVQSVIIVFIGDYHD
jgi:proteic killer suppression protein